MQTVTAIATALTPTANWLARKAMAPIVRRVRAMPDSKLRRFLLWGEPVLVADRASDVRRK